MTFEISPRGEAFNDLYLTGFMPVTKDVYHKVRRLRLTR